MKNRKKKQRHFYHYKDNDFEHESMSIKDENGDVLIKQISLPQRFCEQLKEKYRLCTDIYGVEPPPDMKLIDLLGIDESDINEAFNYLADVMEKMGIAPELIYAYKKTGFVVVEGHEHLFDDKDLIAWQEAIDEYFMSKP